MTDSERPIASEEEALARAVHAVYGAAPEAFVATRKEWVTQLRSGGLREVAKEVGALRKPSVAASAVNALVRADDPVVTTLHEVGTRMRHAQSALDVAAMAGLRGERDDLLAAWVAAARAHAPGGSLTSAVEAEVRDTAVAALADAEATEVVTSGNLTRALSYSGFGEVDVSDAVARTSTGVVLTRIEGGLDEEPDDAVQREEDAGEEEGEGGEDEADVNKNSGGDEHDDDDDDDGDEPQVAAEEPDGEPEGTDEEPGSDPEDAQPVQGAPSAKESDQPASPSRRGTSRRTSDRPSTADRVAELEMELDQAEKAVAAARATRKAAAGADAGAEADVQVAQEQVTQAERLLKAAQAHLEKARRRRTETEEALKAADVELVAARRHRDDARATLEEAEDA